MVINSIGFLLFFVAVFLIYYFPLKGSSKLQNGLLMIASYFFYGYTDYRMLVLLIAVTFIYYFLGIGINIAKTVEKKRFFTISGIVGGVLILFYFKYLNFFIASFSVLFNSWGLHSNIHSFDIVLPLGISFFTFRLISYVIEVNRKTIEPVRDLIQFATYVAFFPCLISGPIDRPQHFVSQLKTNRLFNYELAIDGTRQVLWGVFKKMVIADNLAKVVNDVWGSYTNQSGSTLLFSVVCYSFQIYADFSGYSDMAIGVSKILGIKVARNFSYPYFARNISEFWRKWHISLSSWLMDYIYIPLGGSRSGKLRHFINVIIVFTVCGFWHGANWTFVVWGFYNGLLFLPLVFKKRKINTEVAAAGKVVPSLNDFVSMLLTFSFVSIGWIIFRASNMNEAIQFTERMLSSSFLSKPNYSIMSVYIAALVIIEWFFRTAEYPLQQIGQIKNTFVRWTVYYLIIFVIFKFQGEATQFVYFKF